MSGEAFFELLFKAKRLPEKVIFMQKEEEAEGANILEIVIVKRNLDVEEIRTKRKKAEEEVQLQFQKEIQEHIDEKKAEMFSQEQIDESVETFKENYGLEEKMPPKVSALVAEEKAKLEERYNKDKDTTEAIRTKLKEEYKIEWDSVVSNRPAKIINNVIKSLLAMNLEFRQNLIESSLVQDIDNFNANALLQTGIARLSKFKLKSPTDPNCLKEITTNPVFYRDRIYYFDNNYRKILFKKQPTN